MKVDIKNEVKEQSCLLGELPLGRIGVITDYLPGNIKLKQHVGKYYWRLKDRHEPGTINNICNLINLDNEILISYMWEGLHLLKVRVLSLEEQVIMQCGE